LLTQKPPVEFVLLHLTKSNAFLILFHPSSKQYFNKAKQKTPQ